MINTLIFDRASARARDENGFLRVTGCNITKETVNPYYGREIPRWKDLGLEAGRIYQGLRSGDELQKSIPTWRGLPLMFDHHLDSAANPQKDARVGAVGTDVAWNVPYLTASLTVWDAVERNIVDYDYNVSEDGTLLVPDGGTLTVATAGDFWAVAGDAATVGQKVFAKSADGTLLFGDAGATVADAVETRWYVAAVYEAGSSPAAGDLVLMTTSPTTAVA